MKVLTVSHKQPFYGGAELLLYYLCRYMEREGIRNTLVAPQITPELRKALPGVEMVETGADSKLREMSALRTMVNVMAEEADVINVHNFPATLAVAGLNKPIVWMCNEPPEVFDGLIQEALISRMARKALIKANYWFARGTCTEPIVADTVNAARFEKLYGYAPTIIPYGVDFDYWNIEERRPKDDEFMIMQVGTVTPLKNQLASVRAMEQVIKEIPDAVLWLVGNFDLKDKYAQKILQLIEFKGLRGHVYFLGHRTQDQLRSLYGRAHVVVHPIKPQGGWLTPFEALSAHVPVIVGKEATTCELIQKHALGFVSDEDMLADTIKEIREHYDDYQAKTNKAAEWVRDNLTWDQFCERFVGALKTAIADYATGQEDNKTREVKK